VRLNSVDQGDSTGAPTSRRTVQPYDFRRPTKLSREHIRVLQIVFDAFAKRLTTVLTSSLRQVCSVKVEGIVQRSYEEYVGELPAPTLIVPILVRPLPGTGVLEFSLPVALAAVDHLLGGPGGSQPARALTEIEIGLMDGVLEQFVASLRHAFEPVFPITPQAGTIEYNPQFVQAAAATDAMVVAEFTLQVGREECRATLCLPLAPLLLRLATEQPGDATREGELSPRAVARRMRTRLGSVPVDASVRFAPARVPSVRLMSLQAGDVIALPHRVGAPLSVEVGGETFAAAVAGRSGKKLAALIVDDNQERP
jgi:flagellar motor switch protein FliM